MTFRVYYYNGARREVMDVEAMNSDTARSKVRQLFPKVIITKVKRVDKK